jgi:hypothetical protein
MPEELRNILNSATSEGGRAWCDLIRVQNDLCRAAAALSDEGRSRAW